MGAEITCDICGKAKKAFTDNTTKAVEQNKKEIRFFIQTSFTPPLPDVCTDCFDAALVKLGKLLKGEPAS